MFEVKCDRNCLQCKYSDCIVDKVSIEERLEQDNRDRNYISYGTAVISKASRGKRKYNVMTY